MRCCQKHPTTDVHQKLPIATRHNQKYGLWPSRATQSEKSTQARGDHAPITNFPHHSSKRLLHQKTTSNKTGRRVSNIRHWKNTNLAAMKSAFWKTRPKFCRRHAWDGPSPSTPHERAFLSEKQRNKKITLHSPKGLGENTPTRATIGSTLRGNKNSTTLIAERL